MKPAPPNAAARGVSPHCGTCSCVAPAPRAFVSDVRLLPFDLNRETTHRFKNGNTSTGRVVDVIAFDKDKHAEFGGRFKTYDHLLNSGGARNVREAVKILAFIRRDASAREAARCAPALRRKAEVRRRTPGNERSLGHKRRMVLADDPPCTYCGGLYAKGVDHVLPVSRGGKHGLSNLTPCCWPCNSEKWNRTPEEWKAIRLREGLSWPPVRAVCARCEDKGRTTYNGINRHCACPVGRAMARAHWDAKAAEEAHA